jgi:short-subunit dehydrogenase
MESSSDRPLAVVTGASSGIGLELAKQFASNGFDLIVAAEDDELVGAAHAVEALGAHVELVQVDLATDEGVDELYRMIGEDGRPVDALALNAGVGAGGAFTDTALEDELQLIDLNVRSTVHLAKHVVRDMASRGEGRVLVVSSIAATQPGPFQLVYNASKSFVQSFALGLRDELKDTGVSVTSLMPGPTDTEFFERRGHGGHQDRLGRQGRPGRRGTRGLRGADEGRGAGRVRFALDEGDGPRQPLRA